MRERNLRSAGSDGGLTRDEANWGAIAAIRIAEICIAWAYAYRGDKDSALQQRGRAYELRDSSIMNVVDEPLLKNLVGDPRCQAFLREKSKIPGWPERANPCIHVPSARRIAGFRSCANRTLKFTTPSVASPTSIATIA